MLFAKLGALDSRDELGSFGAALTVEINLVSSVKLGALYSID